MTFQTITDRLVRDLAGLRFDPRITHIYNPLVYARAPYDAYLSRYGAGSKSVVLVGMNPGPWGMVQTGVPFGEVRAVREWMGISGPVGVPDRVHPKRPVTGFACPRSEVSGRRLWGWAEKRFGTPKRFFETFFVINYCPLVFMTESGANRTPDKLLKREREPLFAVCDRALAEMAKRLNPKHLIGVGNFAASRVEKALAGRGMRLGRITHPSPANPKANRGWEGVIEREFAEMGVTLPVIRGRGDNPRSD